ncbi:MAG: hypothetical protein ACRDY2_05640 [Acidimicrobiales bacterium]
MGPSSVLLTFQTVMELRFGALRAGWGELRLRRLERRSPSLPSSSPTTRWSLPAPSYGQIASVAGTLSGTKSTTVTAGSPPLG